MKRYSPKETGPFYEEGEMVEDEKGEYVRVNDVLEFLEKLEEKINVEVFGITKDD